MKNYQITERIIDLHNGLQYVNREKINIFLHFHCTIEVPPTKLVRFYFMKKTGWIQAK